MKKMCAWCRSYIGPVSSEKYSDSIITHGICESCADNVLRKIGRRELGDFLDSLDGPVIVVDEGGTFKTANRKAQEFLQKDLTAIEGKKGGYVFECAHSKLQGGCGNTIHCDGCTIRRTVMATLQSGKSNLRVPAYMDRGTPDDLKRVDFLISTEKVKESRSQEFEQQYKWISLLN